MGYKNFKEPTQPVESLLAPPGRSSWFDLPVDNLSDAMSFYEGLLGWKYRQMEDSALSDYAMIEVNGDLIGGLRQVKRDAPKQPHQKGEATGALFLGHPILYFTVENLSEKVARAKELGAALIGGTVQLGKDRGQYQWIQDRAGNVIGLWGPA